MAASQHSIDLLKLSQIIGDGFGKAHVSIQSCNLLTTGVNARNCRSHFVATDVNGLRYGLKLPMRGVQNGAENEKLVSDLARLLSAPNASKVIQSSGIDFIPIFAGQTVNIIEWAPSSRSVDALLPEDFNEINSGKKGSEFFYQFGQWMSFGLTFGIRDRHMGNWVWNSSDEKLSMIDLETAFLQTYEAEFNMPQFISRLQSSNPIIRAEQRCRLIFGYNRMYGRITRLSDFVATILARYSHTQGYKYQFLGNAESSIKHYLSDFWS